jgi:type IV pilus assembly protein PilX
MSPHPHSHANTRQRGLSLIFALLALLALSLGAVALVRSVDSGTTVLGNLGFKQETVASTERATQAAVEWLAANTTTLDANNTAAGYYASATDNLDATGQLSSNNSRVLVDWNGDTCAYASGTVTNKCTLAARTVASASATEPVTLRYAIFRLCSATGSPTATGNSCAASASAGAGVASDKGSLDYSKPAPLRGTAQGTYYRIVVQAVGARSTSSITETIVQF